MQGKGIVLEYFRAREIKVTSSGQSKGFAGLVWDTNDMNADLRELTNEVHV